ncbi:Cerato-ulmin hydrophobin family [Xylariaceae sp. FL0255]|nr:Cerato-ulmin hydrophobin family [Xylariaceae sp. FL0255]
MQFTTLLVATFASIAVANPVDARGFYKPCTDALYSQPQCCATDVLGVADLDCATPTSVPTSPSDFAAICAKSGDTARCCVIPVLGQSVLCDTPVGL